MSHERLLENGPDPGRLACPSQQGLCDTDKTPGAEERMRPGSFWKITPSALDPHDPRVQMAKALYQDRAHEVGDICQTLHISRSTLYRYPAVPEG